MSVRNRIFTYADDCLDSVLVNKTTLHLSYNELICHNSLHKCTFLTIASFYLLVDFYSSTSDAVVYREMILLTYLLTLEIDLGFFQRFKLFLHFNLKKIL